MAITHNDIPVTWSSNSSLSVGEGVTATSDEFEFSAGAIEADYQLFADNDGTPASGDTVTFRLALSADGTNFPSVQTAMPLGIIDTNAQDADSKTVARAPASAKGKLIVTNNSAGRDITVAAVVRERVES